MTIPVPDNEERRARVGARLGPLGMLVVSGISLGLATALTKIALEQLTPVDVFGIEVAVSAAVLIPLA